jgi:serine/threonine-protein kinase
MTCAACGSPLSPDQRFCGHCGARADLSPDSETSLGPGSTTGRPASDGGRFLPGAMLAGRYRMVGLLGRGGMGEVYRADDLKLGQTVALKFLPRDAEHDTERRERFLTEVRMSLRVTHPNVCRVFDLGQVDDRQFLSMEYVDGEDLASLLRRIGRLPEDKAIEIARQLCAGLAAAHEEGVLHRDLKPANVMIDGRGRAKITDFGLAAATSGVTGAEARAGTPQYMAPEQLAGEALSERTDLYALGLVLYELFTGKRAFEAKTLEELQRHQSSGITNPSAHLTGLDPAVERVILRCLDPDPIRRPASAATVAAALPGGDPLAMAIAAGETPSPEMVARAGGKGGLPLRAAAACLVTLLAGLAGIWFLEGRYALINRIPMPKAPAELAVDARAAIAAAGHVSRPAGSAFGFQRDGDYFAKVLREDFSTTRWDGLASVYPSPLRFWYREGPQPLTPSKSVGVVGPGDPPLIVPGMIRVRLAPTGQLIAWESVPPDRETTTGASNEPEWSRLFAAAGLDLSKFSEADPQWTPPVTTDVRRAWTRDEVRVESGAFRGHAVWFEVIAPWHTGRTGTPGGSAISRYASEAVAILVVLGAVLIARRNIRLGRSDRRGAWRLAVVLVALGTAANLLRMPGHPSVWFSIVSRQLALEIFSGVIAWLFYVALEPYVRRLWPNTLIAWTRVLEGRFRDPLVGRHILLGGLAGLGFSIIFMIPTVAAPWFGGAPSAPGSGTLGALAGTPRLLAAYFSLVQESFALPVTMLVIMLLARVIFPRAWLAYAVLFAVALLVNLGPLPQTVSAAATVALTLLVLTRLGLFAMVVAIVYSYWGILPLTTDPGSWFFPSSVITMLLFAGLAVYGFVLAAGDQLVFKDPLASPSPAAVPPG